MIRSRCNGFPACSGQRRYVGGSLSQRKIQAWQRSLALQALGQVAGGFRVSQCGDGTDGTDGTDGIDGWAKESDAIGGV